MKLISAQVFGKNSGLGNKAFGQKENRKDFHEEKPEIQQRVKSKGLTDHRFGLFV